MLLLASLVACSSPFEGTWLFAADPNVDLTGDCAPEEGADTTTYTGLEYGLVDIYRSAGGELVVFLGEPLIGEPDGADLKAEWSESIEADGYSEESSTILSVTLAGGVLDGTLTEKYGYDYDGDAYSCTSKTRVTAERSVSSSSSYVGE